MRRKDRELTRDEAFCILERGEYGTLSMIDSDGKPYAVPITYAVLEQDIILHSTNADGRRKSSLTVNPEVCFSVVTDTKVLPEQFGTLYCSAIARGKAELIIEEGKKKKALVEFLRKYSVDYIEQGTHYIESAIGQVDVWRIRIQELTGKARKK